MLLEQLSRGKMLVWFLQIKITECNIFQISLLFNYAIMQTIKICVKYGFSVCLLERFKCFHFF